MRCLTLALLAMTAATVPVLAQMSGAEFDALTKGHTFYYGLNGDAPYGAEEYLENQRVRWSFLDGNCLDGYWYEDAGRICFVYDAGPDPQCWRFEQGDAGLVARFDGQTTISDLYELRRSSEPLWCLGPEIGV